MGSLSEAVICGKHLARRVSFDAVLASPTACASRTDHSRSAPENLKREGSAA
jgi:hypothetical protein